MAALEQTEAPHFSRVRGLCGLIFYGIVLVQPITAVGLFGFAMQRWLP